MKRKRNEKETKEKKWGKKWRRRNTLMNLGALRYISTPVWANRAKIIQIKSKYTQRTNEVKKKCECLLWTACWYCSDSSTKKQNLPRKSKKGIPQAQLLWYISHTHNGVFVFYVYDEYGAIDPDTVFAFGASWLHERNSAKSRSGWRAHVSLFWVFNSVSHS